MKNTTIAISSADVASVRTLADTLARFIVACDRAVAQQEQRRVCRAA